MWGRPVESIGLPHLAPLCTRRSFQLARPLPAKTGHSKFCRAPSRLQQYMLVTSWMATPSTR